VEAGVKLDLTTPGVHSDLSAKLYSRLRTSGTLVIAGLIIEILSFFWIHPIAFMSFLVLGCGFLGVGIVLFLWTLVTMGR
jgi:hypothetical protein